MKSERNNKLTILNGLQELIPEYDAFIIDLWGVVHNGVTAYPGAVECLNYLIANNKAIIFMTNAPQSSNSVLQKLLELNISAKLEMMLTSGDTTRRAIKNVLINNPSTKYYHLGTDIKHDILLNLELNLVDNIKNSNVILLTAYIPDHEDLDQFDSILKQAATLNIPIICTNPDHVATHGNTNIYCAGFLADKYEKLGGKVEYYGKPHLPIYQAAFDRLLTQGIFNKKRILMIGDTLATDILGAKNAGIDSALVLTGNVGKIFKNTNHEQLTVLEHMFIENDLFPTYILQGLS